MVLFAQLVQRLGNEWEFLQRGDDDGRAARQRLGQLARVFVNLLHHALLVLKLVNGVLQLRVQHLPIGHHNHRVKHLVVCRIVQAAQAVRQPGNRVGLARPRRMLHQVVAPRPVRLCVGHQLAHRVQLVVAREDHGFFVDLLDALVGEDALVFFLQVHEAAHDV